MHVEVLILGAGPAGCAAGQILARLDRTVLIVEAERGRRGKVGECIPAESRPLLDTLGLLSALKQHHAPVSASKSSWATAALVEDHALGSIHGTGFHVDRARFEAELGAAARASGADLRYGTALESLERAGDTWLATFPQGSERRPKQLTADFVMDATGRRAWFARHLGVRRVHADRLVGVGQTVPGAGSLADRTTLVEATEGGWWYSAPVPGGGLVVTYMTDADLVHRHDLLTPAGWSKALAKTRWTRARVPCSPIRPWVRPAGNERSVDVHGDGWLCAGDAAMAFDPLSSYGIVSALGSGYYAARAVHDHLRGRVDALDTCQAIFDSTWGRTQGALAEAYADVRRWPDSPFWARRRSPPKAQPTGSAFSQAEPFNKPAEEHS